MKEDSLFFIVSMVIGSILQIIKRQHELGRFSRRNPTDNSVQFVLSRAPSKGGSSVQTISSPKFGSSQSAKAQLTH